MESQSHNNENLNNNGLARTFEDKARRIKSDLESRLWDKSPTAMIEREIALTLDHIDKARRLQEQQKRSLNLVESYIGTEILQRSPNLPDYYDTRINERDMLRARLVKVERERRGLASLHQEKLQALHDRLLELLHKHAHLRPGGNGD